MPNALPSQAPIARDSWWRRLTAKTDGHSESGGLSELPPPSHALLDVAADSLQRCGFVDGGFRIELVHRRQGPPTLLVELAAATSAVWEFSAHLELYLIDRIRRHTGLSVGRIVLAPMKAEGLTLASARNGARAVWSSLQKTRQPGGAEDPLDLTSP